MEGAAALISYKVKHPEPPNRPWAWRDIYYDDGTLVALPVNAPQEEYLVGIMSSVGVVPRIVNGEGPIERGARCPWPLVPAEIQDERRRRKHLQTLQD